MVEPVAPLRPVTSGPGFRWFGYYDKLLFSADGCYELGMRVGLDHRSPTRQDATIVDAAHAGGRQMYMLDIDAALDAHARQASGLQ